MCSVARGSTVGGRAPSAATSSWNWRSVASRHFGDRLVEGQVGKVALGAGVDLVVDVGDVAGVDHVIGAVEMAQQAEEHVEHDDRPRVADMGEVVDRRAADIEPHRAGSIGAKSSLRRVSVL